MARVLDLTGPPTAYCGRLLAEMGNDVIRIEPARGDGLRRLGPFLGNEIDLERGAFHEFLNAGKRSFTPNLDCAEGRQLLVQLCAASDAVVGSAPLPVDEDEMLKARSNLVITRVDDGLPELCAYARSGLLALTGSPDGPPMLLGGHAAHTALGSFVAIGVMSALFAQQTTGQGQLVDLSIQECLAVLGEQGLVARVTGQPFERRGYRGIVTAVSGAFKCADGYAMLSVPARPENWRRFMEWVQDPVLAEDQSLAEEAERRARKDYIFDRLEPWAAQFDQQEFVDQAQLSHTPAAPVTTALDLAEDPQLIARGFLQKVEDPDLGSVMVPVGALATLRGSAPVAAPRIGEHNAEILTELGYSASQQAALKERAAI